MTIRSGSRAAEPTRVIQGRSKRRAHEALAGNPAAASPRVGLPSPILELQQQLKRLEARVAVLESRAKGGQRGA